MINALVSIIVPCFNQAEYLSETLDSVLVQTYLNWECIIVNDGSTDNTQEIALKYCEKDNRFKYVYKKNGGLASARNFGIRKCFGEFILPLDSDDIINKNYLFLAIQYFEKNSDVKLVYCRAELFGNSTGEWKLKDYKYIELLFENIIFCSAIYRRKDYDLTLGYNETFKEGLEDWDFWLSLINETDKVYKIPEILFYYRIRSQSMLRSISEDTSYKLRVKIYNIHFEKYQNYIPQLIWSNSQIQNQKKIILNLEKEINRIQISKAYRLGKILIKPIKFLYSIIK